MKSHDLAQALNTLARVLRSAPNMEISQLQVQNLIRAPQSSSELALNLSTLVSLSKVDKSRWIDFINEQGFPIEIRNRDASRDVFGKLCSYLEANPLAQEHLRETAAHSTNKSSPELMKALSTLLKDTRNEPSTKGN